MRMEKDFLMITGKELFDRRKRSDSVKIHSEANKEV